MPKPVAVQLHFWPWSVGVRDETLDLASDDNSFPFYGSPVISAIQGAKLFLPHRHEQFRPTGLDFQTHAGNCQLFQAPHGVLAQAHKEFQKKPFEIHIRTNRNSQMVHLQPEGANPRFVGTNDEKEETKLARAVLAWSQFFDNLIEGCEDTFGENQLSWKQVRQEMEKEAQEADEPRKALIVGIAERMNLRIVMVVLAARKILQRQRRMIQAARVCETDRGCIRWLVRQPGKNLAEKAAINRQQLMGIIRKETHNTLENRVLKDFLFRCAQEGNRYLKTDVGNRFENSRRAKQVRGYRHLCRELHQAPHLHRVKLPPVGVRPNYVLQNDYRYRQVWKDYKRLLRREDEEDSLWDWQSRTWADVARVLLSAALFSMANPNSRERPDLKEILSSRIRLYKEQRLGSRIAAGSEPGPFIWGTGSYNSNVSILEVVHPDQAGEHPDTKSLGRLGGHLYIVINPLSGNRKTVLVMWAVHTAGSANKPEWTKIALSAGRALRSHQSVLDDSRIPAIPLLKGFVIASDLAKKEADLHGGENEALHLVQVGADQRCWSDALAGISSILEFVLEGA